MLYVKCSHDLYGGDTKADKWYEVIEVDADGVGFTYKDEVDQILYCLVNRCAYLDNHPGAFWTFKEE